MKSLEEIQIQLGTKYYGQDVSKTYTDFQAGFQACRETLESSDWDKERQAAAPYQIISELEAENTALREGLELIAAPSEFNCAVGEGNLRAAACNILAKFPKGDS